MIARLELGVVEIAVPAPEALKLAHDLALVQREIDKYVPVGNQALLERLFVLQTTIEGALGRRASP